MLFMSKFIRCNKMHIILIIHWVAHNKHIVNFLYILKIRCRSG